MKIAVIGTGYVGLVTGTCFAETGNQVICVDIDERKVERLRSGEIPIYEPGLEPLFDRNRQQGRLTFTTSLSDAIEKAQLIFLALPTPPGEDGSADLSYVLGVARQIGPMLKSYKVVVNKSTVPVGTGEKVRAALLEKADPSLFDVVSNPEFLREGVAVEDFMKPDRVVIGVESEAAKTLMEDLYAPFVRQGNPILYMDIRSAEMTKYAANAYLATRISFMNEIANLCETLGADVDQVRKGIGSDSRIGKRFLFAGAGYGGSCFPKDVQALYKTAQLNGYDFKILEAVMGVNDRQRHTVSQKVLAYFGDNLVGKKIAIWGLSFKPNTDDIREAPALYVIEDLLHAGASVSVFDPEAMPNVERVLGRQIAYGEDSYEILDGADALVIMTEWSVFRTPDFEQMLALMKTPVIFDGRNLFDLGRMSKTPFYYNSIGRDIVQATT